MRFKLTVYIKYTTLCVFLCALCWIIININVQFMQKLKIRTFSTNKQLNMINTFENSTGITNRNPKGAKEPHNVNEQTSKTFNRFANYTLDKPPVFVLGEDKSVYFTVIGNTSCLILGTDIPRSQSKQTHCVCKYRWFGPWCSFPTILSYSNIGSLSKVRIRERPRRILCGLPYNMEYDSLEARLADTGPVVDAFLISESNYTGYGDQKPLYLYNKLKQGFLWQYHHQIVHVYLDYFPERAHDDGWIADALFRDIIGQKGLKMQVAGARDDDIFLVFDSDEIPTMESLLFLKLHDGYPEPFGHFLKKFIYGYFWTEGFTDIMSGSTVSMLRRVFRYKAYNLRNAARYLLRQAPDLPAYVAASSGVNVKMWKFGRPGTPAGWHCSWCFDPAGIRNKLVSAINADFPRWGDYPEKLKLDYIRDLIKHGKWFNGRKNTLAASASDLQDVPPFVLKSPKRFNHLLHNPYVNSTVENRFS